MNICTHSSHAFSAYSYKCEDSQFSIFGGRGLLLISGMSQKRVTLRTALITQLGIEISLRNFLGPLEKFVRRWPPKGVVIGAIAARL